MVKMQRNQRSVLGKIVVALLTLLALVGLAAMTMSVISCFISPKRFVWASFFGLAFWEIFFYNCFVLLLLVLMWSKKAWISVIALLIAIPGLGKSYAFGSPVEETDGIRLMSYNIHNFDHVDGRSSKVEFVNEVLAEVGQQSPDVVCFQEFSRSFKEGSTRQQCIEMFAQTAGYPYVYYNLKRNYGGNVIFSRYPLQKVADDTGFGKENTYGVMVSVDAGEKGKFYVANVHLLSYSITDEEIGSLPEVMSEELDTVRKTIVKKLQTAFVRRSDEIKEVIEGMPEVDAPIIVCGDFNDAPLSYTYRQMKKAGFNDTFVKVGKGINPTYGGKLPLLRIDYIWGNDGVKPLQFNCIKKKLSDHYPVILDFKIEQNNEN